MSMLNFLARALGFPHLGLHDLDLPDEPTVAPEDTSTPTVERRIGVDGPAVSSGEASAAGQPNFPVDWDYVWAELRAVREALAEAEQGLREAQFYLSP